ncbi:MAG: hypothetical protein ACRDTD_22380 [Pseudonocardiaceae bacterium]
MERDVETVEPDEAIFELHEVPGPVFALKQQGDAVRGCQLRRWSATTSDTASGAEGFRSGPGSRPQLSRR